MGPKHSLELAVVGRAMERKDIVLMAAVLGSGKANAHLKYQQLQANPKEELSGLCSLQTAV